jgi:hypothetical protein
MNHDVKLMSQVMRCCDYYSTSLPCGMPHQHHKTISYNSPKVVRINGILLLLNFGSSKIHWKGVDEFKWAKIDVKTSTFLQFLLHLSMWCHFNGMLIMESCAYWIILILKNLKWIKQNFNIKIWFVKSLFNNFIQWHYLHKGLLIFIIQFISSLIFFYSNKVLLDMSKKHSNFHIFLILCLSKMKV